MFGELFEPRVKRPALDDLARPYKHAGRDIRVRIDDADLDLIAEAIARGCRRTSYTDAQILGRFYHYTVKIDRVEFELITTKPVEASKAKRARYLGMTIDQYRKAFTAREGITR